MMYPNDGLRVELSDSKEITALLAAQKQAQRPQAAPRARVAARSARRRCHCGACSTCLENARWEKIFNEKFADPNYYKPHPVRHTSSLSWPAR